MHNNYYWSDDWSNKFYIELAKVGFISTTHETKEDLLLLPEIQYSYAVLDFKNLHISKNVKKILKKNNCHLCFNTRFNEVLHQFSKQHKYNWLKGKYLSLMENIYKNESQNNDFELISVELISNKNTLIAGEIGYSIGRTYTSLSGFSSKEKEYTNYGTLQLVLLAQHLEKSGFDFWNLGHPHMEYKRNLGSHTLSRGDFLKKWQKSTHYTTIKIKKNNGL